MRCDHCNFRFDTVALKAKQGTRVECPLCGAQTTVRYSLRDTLSDIPGVIKRDPKYVSQPLTVIFWVVFGIVALLILFAWLR